MFTRPFHGRISRRIRPHGWEMIASRQRFMLSSRHGHMLVNKPLWRYLQTSDHFYYMASKYGTCGEVHTYFSHHEAEDAFQTYMRVLADYESRNIRMMKNRKSAKILRTLSPEQAFHFACPSGFIGHTAYNLDQFEELLYFVPQDSLNYHQERGDFARWITDVLDDPSSQRVSADSPNVTTFSVS